MDKEKIEEIEKLKGSIDLLEDVFRKAQGHLNNVIMQSAKVYQQSKHEDVCEWREIEPEFGYRRYSTSCGDIMSMRKTPEDNGIKFCGFCSLKIKVVEDENG